MPTQQRRRFTIAASALLGTLLGAASGFLLGQAILLHNASGALGDYTNDLIQHADEYNYELAHIRGTFNPSEHPFCSPQEITAMRTLAFQSLQVKDIGRVRDGMLRCSAILGNMAVPWPMPVLTLELPGTKVYANVPLAIAGYKQGTVLESQGVDVVLSPNAFDHWGRSHTRYMVLIVDAATRHFVPIAGDDLTTDPSLVFTQGERQDGSNIYRTRCSSHNPTCVIAQESTADALTNSGALLIGYSGLGSLTGFSLSLAITQFYLQRKGLTQQLRRAVRKGDLTVVYQPVLELPSRKCAGAEALLRWSDEEGKPVSPDVFIRIAEDRSFIGELTALVLRKSIAEVGYILREHPDLILSINIASSDLEGEHLFTLLEQYVQAAGIRPCQIALELTERATADVPRARTAIQGLHAMGYKIHIDDFGTGFSSLAYLHELAVDAIKIDRAFTNTIGTEAVTASILPSILALAESLQLEVIVEGVETEAQAQYLADTGKTMHAQGWHFGRPVNAAGLRLYRERKHAESQQTTA